MIKSWSMVRLGEIAVEVERLETPEPGTQYRQIGVQLWGKGAYERETIDGSETKYAKLNRVEAGDIIVNKIWARNGSVSVVPKTLTGSYASGEFPTFTARPDALLPEWFNLFTKTRACWEQCDQKSRGTSGKNRIRPEQFLAVEIPLPPLPEQRRLVAHIDGLAAKIGEAKKLREKTEAESRALRDAAANDVFTGGWMARWPKSPMGEVADIRSGVTLGRNLKGRTIGLPYLRVANVQDGHLDLNHMKEVQVLEDEKDKWALQRGDLLLTEGGDWDKLGRGTVWNDEIPNCIHQNHIFRVRTKSSEFDPYFLSALVSSPYGKSYFQEASKQTTNLASINQRQLKALNIFRPPLEEQHRIVAYLDSLSAKTEALKKLQAATAAQLDALLPSLLDQAFRGEL